MDARAPFRLLPLVALAAVLALVLLNVASFAYRQLGLSAGEALLMLFLSVAGSAIDLPVARLRSRRAIRPLELVLFGVPPRVAAALVRQLDAVVAVNVGGAVVPAVLSIWLLATRDLWWQTLVAAVLVGAVAHRLARVVDDVGIVVPALATPVAAALVALALTGEQAAPVTYAAGTIGTLVGADLLNLRRLRASHVRVASIGGGGTFDAVFLSGVLGVALAAVLSA